MFFASDEFFFGTLFGPRYELVCMCHRGVVLEMVIETSSRDVVDRRLALRRDFNARSQTVGMRRRFRRARSFTGLGLTAQNRQNLFGEHVELFENFGERQSRMVDEEELPLVISHVLTEGQRAIDDLLRRADGQRRFAGAVPDDQEPRL